MASRKNVRKNPHTNCLHSISTISNNCPGTKLLLKWRNMVALSYRSFSEKNIEKKHLCYHDKNNCYFCKSNIPVINLIAGGRNMIKLSKNISL